MAQPEALWITIVVDMYREFGRGPGSWYCARGGGDDGRVCAATLVEVQTAGADGDAPDSSEALLLARGLELSSPPTVHQVLDAQPLMRCVSTERQFLSDFVAGAESTAGGRLARWLAPTSRVEPANCELKGPTQPVRPLSRITLPVIVRDQYGEVVCSPALKVEVVVQRLSAGAGRALHADGQRARVPDVPYQPTVRETMCFHAITMMKVTHSYILRISSHITALRDSLHDLLLNCAILQIVLYLP
ncbi:hypothetical protein B5X24_HaOG211903 [Helicoverpa armigera]|nr:hypothetical protein B5X24_HaOG211903 [Helicoverpa armigera]